MNKYLHLLKELDMIYIFIIVAFIAYNYFLNKEKPGYKFALNGLNFLFSLAIALALIIVCLVVGC